MPGLAAGAGSLCKALALLVGAIQPTEVTALSQPNTGDEEAHRSWRLCVGTRAQTEDQETNRGARNVSCVHQTLQNPAHAILMQTATTRRYSWRGCQARQIQAAI
jgi:hypothetical protein